MVIKIQNKTINLKLYKTVVFLFSFFFFFTSLLFSDELSYYLPYLGSFSASTNIPSKYLEINSDYGLLNSSVDILNLKSQMTKSLKNYGANIGNYEHESVLINYGLTDTVMLHGSYIKRKLNFGTGNLKINSYNFYIKKSFNSIFSFEIGYKRNKADNLKMSDVNEMNYYLQKFQTNLSIEVERNYFWLTRKYPTMTLSIGFLKTEDPYFVLKDMNDSSNYYKLIIGKAYKIFYPNFFIEYGKTDINTKIDSNILKMIPDRYKTRFPSMPYNLHRKESYYKIGFSLFIKTPFHTLTQVQYSFIKLYRSKDLNYVNYNHIFKGKIGYFLNRYIILTLGGKLFYRQFNGEIPFLYNKYTQTTFDHPYGWVEFGLIIRFD